MNDRPPLTIAQRDMAQRTELGPKAQMVQLGEATYVKHCGEWWLLDAERHGHRHGGDDGP